MKPTQARRPRLTQNVAATPIGDGACSNDFRRLTTAKLQYQPRGDLQPIPDKSGIKTAFEAITSVTDYVELAAGGRRAHRVEESGLDEHFGCHFRTGGRLASDHAAEALHPSVVGNRSDLGIKRVFLPVEREQGFPRSRRSDRQIAVQPAGIEHMQRTVDVE